jgi:hypothetical protein
MSVLLVDLVDAANGYPNQQLYSFTITVYEKMYITSNTGQQVLIRKELTSVQDIFMEYKTDVLDMSNIDINAIIYIPDTSSVSSGNFKQSSSAPSPST